MKKSFTTPSTKQLGKAQSFSLTLFFVLLLFNLNAQTVTSSALASPGQNVKSESAGNVSTAASPATTVKFTSVKGKKIADNGFFTYEVTGDVNKDADLYQLAKEKFMSTNPELYNKWSHGGFTNSTQNQSKKQ